MSTNHDKTPVCLISCLRKVPGLQTATSRHQHTRQMVPLLLHHLLTWKASSHQLPPCHSRSLKGLGHSCGHHKVSSSNRAGQVWGAPRQVWGHSQVSLSLAWKCSLVRRWATCQVDFCMCAFICLSTCLQSHFAKLAARGQSHNIPASCYQWSIGRSTEFFRDKSLMQLVISMRKQCRLWSDLRPSAVKNEQGIWVKVWQGQAAHL